MSTPSIQTLITQAQQVLNLKSSNEIRATLAAVLANANVGTPLNPNLTTQQLWDEFYEIVRQPSDDIMSIITDQMMRMVFSPPAPGGAGADKQVIFNDGGVLAGDTKFLWDKNANRLDVDGPVVITGDLTVATSTLKVDSTNNRVGIGTATPVAGDKLTVAGGVTINNTTTPISEYFADVSAYADFGAALTVRSNSNPSVYRERIVSTRGQYADQMGWKITTQSGSGTEKASFSIAPSGNVSVYGSTTVSTTNYIGSSTWAAQFEGASNGASSGLSLLSYSAGGQPTPASLHVVPIADYRSALVATFSADASGAGYFAVNQYSPAGATTVERFRVDRDGNVSIATGNLVMTTSGKGIDFSAVTGGTGTATANVLNDYEEGTWVPAINALLGTFTTTTLSTATYTKIGRMVAIQAKFVLTTIGTGSVGFQLTNLPFTSSPTNAFAIGGKNLSSDADFGGFIESTGTTMRFVVVMVNNHTYVVNGTYFV